MGKKKHIQKSGRQQEPRCDSAGVVQEAGKAGGSFNGLRMPFNTRAARALVDPGIPGDTKAVPSHPSSPSSSTESPQTNSTREGVNLILFTLINQHVFW